jgi:hypothetical protein
MRPSGGSRREGRLNVPPAVPATDRSVPPLCPLQTPPKGCLQRNRARPVTGCTGAGSRRSPGEWRTAQSATPIPWVPVIQRGDTMTEAIAIVVALLAAFVLVQYWLPRHK